MRYITRVNLTSVRKKRPEELGDLGLPLYLVFLRLGSKTRLTDAGILRPVTSRKMRSMGLSGGVLSGIRHHKLEEWYIKEAIRTKHASDVLDHCC
jgi:hypothetical protein